MRRGSNGVSRTRLLLIGIDGANPDLLLKWCAAGDLPHLSALFERGQWTKTWGLEGFFIGSTWPSIYTGTGPARHGFHYQYQLRPGTYEFHRPEEHGLIHGEPFWRVLSDAGHRVAILDVPLSPLENDLDGMQIVEWGGHDRVYGFQAHPPQIEDVVRSHFGPHPVGTPCDAVDRSTDDYRSFVDRLVEGVGRKAEMSCGYLREGGWDCFMQVFSESHCVGHQCWHLHDPTHPAYDASVASAVGDPIRRVYQAIDSAIGEMVQEAGDCMTFVFSSHGMSHWYGAQFLLREILFQLEAARPPEPPAQVRDLRFLALQGATQAWHLLPRPVREALGGLRRRFGPGMDELPARPTPGVDLQQSRCFPLSNGLALGGIRLNLAGREPHGLLTPGAEAEAFCRTLAADLTAIIDERTGAPLIRRVLRVSDLYQGPHLDGLPDLVVDYDDSVATGSTGVGSGLGAQVRLHSPKFGLIEGANSFGRTGEHRPEGLLLAAGPGLGQHALTQPVSVLDLAPTWTRALGVRLANAEGRPIPGLIVDPQ